VGWPNSDDAVHDAAADRADDVDDPEEAGCVVLGVSLRHLFRPEASA
jgi:hypothetical protein